jgi:hypothetical protein
MIMRLFERFVSPRWLHDERGDVPGWVMITVMTIIIASSILVIFQNRVTSFLSDALNQYM